MLGGVTAASGPIVANHVGGGGGTGASQNLQSQMQHNFATAAAQQNGMEVFYMCSLKSFPFSSCFSSLEVVL